MLIWLPLDSQAVAENVRKQAKDMIDFTQKTHLLEWLCIYIYKVPSTDKSAEHSGTVMQGQRNCKMYSHPGEVWQFIRKSPYEPAVPPWASVLEKWKLRFTQKLVHVYNSHGCHLQNLWTMEMPVSEGLDGQAGTSFNRILLSHGREAQRHRAKWSQPVPRGCRVRDAFSRTFL